MEKDIYIDFGKRLTALRLSYKLSQIEMARALGVVQTTYSGYENAQRKIPLELLPVLANLFDVPMVYLVTGERPQHYTDNFVRLSAQEHSIMSKFRFLNAEGKEKLGNYADDLIASKNYKKRPSHSLDNEQSAEET